jgi:hypothetical protein
LVVAVTSFVKLRLSPPVAPEVFRDIEHKTTPLVLKTAEAVDKPEASNIVQFRSS